MIESDAQLEQAHAREAANSADSLVAGVEQRLAAGGSQPNVRPSGQDPAGQDPADMGQKAPEQAPARPPGHRRAAI